MNRALNDPWETPPPGQRGTQVAEIVDVLRQAIVSGQFGENQWLKQQEIALEFKVSRIPVREALRLLEAEGLVVLDPNKGARVAPLSIADLREIYEMRLSAETLALRNALPEISNAQIGKAEAIQNQIEKAPVEEYGILNGWFHHALYAPCARPRLLAHIDVLSQAADRYLRLTIAGLDYAEISNRGHRDLLEACAHRDEVQAIHILQNHIADAGEKLIEWMDQARSQA